MKNIITKSLQLVSTLLLVLTLSLSSVSFAMDSKINLQLYNPNPVVRDAENFFDLYVVNQSNSNYQGSFEVNAQVANTYDITYVDADTRLNCVWLSNKVKCVTKNNQDAGMDTSYRIKVKYWASATNYNPINFKAILTTNSSSQANIYQVVTSPY